MWFKSHSDKKLLVQIAWFVENTSQSPGELIYTFLRKLEREEERFV